MELQVDGKTVFYASGGRAPDAGQPSVIFIHGAGADHTAWVLQTRYFAYHGRNVLAIDLPGHGRSEGPAIDSVGGLADWLMALLDAAGLEKAALVGHSLGSLAALEAAARQPGRVWALALLGSAIPMAVSDGLLAAAKANDPAAFDMITIWAHGAEAQIGRHTVPGLWMTGNGLRLLERSRPGVLHTDLKACNDYQGGMQAAARVTCPTLLLLGDGDRMTPPQAARPLAQAITGAETVVLPRCGHMMSVEQPDAVLDRLREIV